MANEIAEAANKSARERRMSVQRVGDKAFHLYSIKKL
jgi:hypothetical protein